MLNIIFAVLIALAALAVGSVAAFAAWNTMYPDEEGHIVVKVFVNAFTVLVFLIFCVYGFNGVYALLN